jgi:hypothetical protein
MGKHRHLSPCQGHLAPGMPSLIQASDCTPAGASTHSGG